MQDVDETEDFLRMTHYDQEHKLLSVMLKSGERVRFRGVPLARFELLQCSEDKRRFFEKYIRGRHEEEIVEAPVILFHKRPGHDQA